MQKIERPTREEQPKLLPGRTPKPKNTGHHKKNNGIYNGKPNGY